jgi:hypothetical protein
MLDQLLQIIQQQGQQSVVANPAIPNDQNSAVLGEAGSSIMGGLQQAISGGGLSQVMSMFSQGSSTNGVNALLSNPLVQSIVQKFSGNLTSQHNIDPTQASQVGQQLIPSVLSGLAGRVTDPNDSSIDINGVMRSLAGDGAAGIDFQGILSKFQAGDVDGDGDSDLQDVIARLSGGASGSGSGLMDMVKGFFQ